MNRRAKWTWFTVAAFGALLIAGAFSFTRPLRAGKLGYPGAPAAAGLVQRGEYLVTTVGCHDCHTPLVVGETGPEPDMTRMLSGHPQDFVDGAPIALPTTPGLWMWAPTNTAFVGPWGKSYAINLTPDENTGIGIWAEDTFVQALRTGKHWGVSRPILPPMPWQALSKMTDEDLRAIYSYLRTIPPVVNRVPDAEPIG